jgi:hypothetical protein
MIRMVKHVFLCALVTWVVVSACATSAHAQGSRRDDIVFNAQGRPMAGASVRVCTSAATGQPCTPLAQIYSDSALTQALANPTSTDGLGNYNFYAAPGRYMIEISGPGITTKQIPNVLLPSDPSTPTFTSVTTTSGISAFSLSLTGNLTVNGSTAVAGSLSVGGLPVPGSNQDNQWTAGQRFKGPIPWRDISGYMPPGGCSSTIAQTDPPTTGTISSGSSTLTLGNARDFKNGCGIAVLNAGPTSTLTAPNQGCSISSITRSSNVVTITCAAAHNIPVGAFDHTQGIQITGVTDSSYNGTFDVTGVADTTHFTYAQTGANSSSSSGTATMQFGYAHGLTGSTTYNYKVSAVDALGGMGPASAALSVTNANATLTTSNYNWINFGVASSNTALVPHEWVIYSDKGLGGAYSCVGVSFTNAYSDFGLPMPCPAFAPSTPPAAATAQVLNAIINAGGGTTSLTLSVSASNTATTQNVYHDESSFLNACVNDDLTDRTAAGFPGQPGAYGCYLPAGNYFFNGQLPTDNVAASGMTIRIAGSVFLNVFPWYISQNGYTLQGMGDVDVFPQFAHSASSTTYVHVSTSLGAAFVLRGTAFTSVNGFGVPGFKGHGIWAGTVAYLGSPNSYRFDDDALQSSVTGGGAPLVFDNNVIGVWVNNTTLAPGGGLASILITGDNWNGIPSCCMYFNNIATEFRGVKIDMPGGLSTGGGHNSFYFTNWINESLGSAELGLIVHDTGPNAPGAANSVASVSGISVHNVNNSDPINGPSAYTLFTEIGSALSINTVDVNQVNSFGGMLSCGPNTTVCNDRGGPSSTTAFGSSTLGGTWGNQFQVGGNAIHAEMPILSKLAYNAYGQTPSNPAWAQVFPAPNLFSITGTGAGSLAAATYCMAVEGKDAQATPGLTLPTNTLCQAVGASSSISLQWNQASGNLNQAYSGFRFLYCSTGGSSCVPNNYIPDLAAGGNPYAYTFTSTAGSTATSLNSVSTAYLSWLYWDRGAKSCFFCTSTAGSSLWQLGIGESNPAAGVKLAVAGGTLQGEGGIQAGADVAFNASPRGSYNAFLPNLTSTAATYQRMTLDKAVTVTRLQLVLGTAGAGCTTQSTVSVTDGTSSVTLTTANGTATYDSGAVSQNFAAAANLDIKIAAAASGCATAPQNANVNVQYRMQ